VTNITQIAPATWERDRRAGGGGREGRECTQKEGGGKSEGEREGLRVEGFQVWGLGFRD
jgi:hypothetical protein